MIHEKYRIEFFNVLMDQCIMSLNERFSQLQLFKQHFGFLFNIRGLSRNCATTESDTELRLQCEQLQSFLSKVDPIEEVDGCRPAQDEEEEELRDEMIAEQSSEICRKVSDIDAISLFDELKNLSTVLPDNVASPLEVLRYNHATRLHECFANVSTALRILLTVPVTVASGERSFSKLKLIKTYLRSTMTQDRFNGLALLSIENDIATSLNYTDLLSVFANAKARKIIL